MYLDLFRKYLHSYRNVQSGPWKWFFCIKDTLQSISSQLSFVTDQIFIFKENDGKLLFKQGDSLKFEINCINLQHRQDKRIFIEQQFINSDFQFNIFPAVDGSLIDTKRLLLEGILSPSNRCYASGVALTPAQIGVYLSHRELWKKMQQSSNKVALILEDDALILFDKKVLEQFVKHIPEDADLFFINRRKNKVKPISPYVSKYIYRFWGLTAYFITQKGADKLLSLTLPIQKSVDDTISELNQKGLITCYCARKELVVECSNAKDTQNFRFHSDICNRVAK